MRILYFAWLRNKTGTGQEDVDLPDHVKTVQDLTAFLAARGNGYAEAFADTSCIRAAIDQEFAELDTVLPASGEIAFFPPVTGG